MYLLQRIADNKYVAPGGQEHSYASDIRNAQRFATRVEADTARCVESEVVVTLESQLRPTSCF